MVRFLGSVLVLSIASALGSPVPGRSNSPVFGPEVVGPSPANEADIVRLPDGSLKIFYMIMGERVESMHSSDGGRSWTEPRVEFEMENKRSHHACRTLIDRDGEVHVFFVVHVDDVELKEARGGRALDVWHNRTLNGRAEWRGARRAFVGYVGAIRGAAQLPGGRIVVPFGVWNGSESEPRSGPPETGSNFVSGIYSDDGGQTFQVSPSVVTAPVFEGYNGANYGAVEPSIEILEDGRAWLLIRTQTGFLYESFSSDGKTWSDARPTRFYSSNSPAAALRLDDGRIVVLWNNTQMPPRQPDGGMLYAGRDALHAAISDDGGRTWRGFREIYLDPTRHRDPPPRGDRGTAYPNAAQAPEGHLVVVTGQGEAHRNILLFHPDWLLESSRANDFRDGVAAWTAFKEHGESYGIFLPRILGPEVKPLSDATGGNVLHVRRPDHNAPDSAIWNFPAGRRGVVTVRLMHRQGGAGARLTLTDRFYNPDDETAEKEAMFVVAIDRSGRFGDVQLQSDRWHTVRIAFDASRRTAELSVDHRPAGSVAQGSETVNGVSYLRIRSVASEPDPNGIFVDSVEARIE